LQGNPHYQFLKLGGFGKIARIGLISIENQRSSYTISKPALVPLLA
jgi:hypothetical protein